MHKFWRSAAECLVASLALAALTVICYRLHVNIATAGLLFVIVVVIISRVGNFASSVFAAVIAALCLANIAPPAFSFEVDDPLDVVAILAFLVISLVIAGPVSQVRKQAEDAFSSVSYRVIEPEEQERRRIASDLHEDIGQRLTLLVLEVEQLKTTPDPTADVPSGVDALLQKSSEILTDVKGLGTRVVLSEAGISWHSGGHEQFLHRFRQAERGRDWLQKRRLAQPRTTGHYPLPLPRTTGSAAQCGEI